MPRPDDSHPEEVLARVSLQPEITIRNPDSYFLSTGTLHTGFFKDAIPYNCMFDRAGKGQDASVHTIRRPGARIFSRLEPGLVPRGITTYRGAPKQAPILSGIGATIIETVEEHRRLNRDYILIAIDNDLLVHPGVDWPTGERFTRAENDVGWPTSAGGFASQVQFAARAGLTSVYAIISNRGGTTQVWSKSTSTDAAWTLLTSAPGWVARDNFQVVHTSTHIYIMGGTNAAGTRLNDVWRSADGITWTQQTAAAAWAARHSFGACVNAINNRLWVAAGNTAAGVVRDVWFSTDGGVVWTQATAAAPWSAREGIGLASVDYGDLGSAEILTMIGGSTGQKDAWISSDGITWFLSRDDVGLTGVGPTAAWTASGTSHTPTWVYAKNQDTRFVRCEDGNRWETFDGTAVSSGEVNDLFTMNRSIMYTANLDSLPGAFPLTSEFKTLLAVSDIDRDDVLRAQHTRNPQLGWFHNLWPNGFADDVTDIGRVTFEPLPPEADDLRDRKEELEGVFIKSQHDAYLYNTRVQSLNKVEDDDYPRYTLPGAAWLNGRVYVMTPEGRIYGSDVNAPLSWSALNFVSAIRDPDKGVGIIRRGPNLLAFGQHSIEWFYDSGELVGAVGSTLRRIDSSWAEIGCLNMNTVQRVGETIIFCGRQETTRERGVYLMDGYTPRKVSTPQIDKILELHFIDGGHASTMFQHGHRLYLLTMGGSPPAADGTDFSGVTVVYDLDMDAWYLWNTEETHFSSPTSLTAALNTSTGLVEITVTNPDGNVFQGDYAVGDPIKLSGATQTEYNGTFPISSLPVGSTIVLQTNLTVVPTTPATTTTRFLLKDFPVNGFVPYIYTMMTSFVQVPVPTLQVEGGGEASDGHATRTFGISFFNPCLVEIDRRFTTDAYHANQGTSLIPNNVGFHYINFFIRTPRLDNNNNLVKFASRLEVIGDRLDYHAYIRWSDNDGRSYTRWHQLNLDSERPRLSRLGRFRRRQFEVRIIDDTPWSVLVTNNAPRLEALEMFLRMGNPS